MSQKKQSIVNIGVKVVVDLISLIVIAIINYCKITPWNIHSGSMWVKIFLFSLVIAGNMVIKKIYAGMKSDDPYSDTEGKFTSLLIPLGVFVAIIIIIITGMQLFNAERYKNIISVKETTAADAVPNVSDLNSIALMDSQSATRLGDRKIGEIESFSAFDVASGYMQLNVGGEPVKVAPLIYKGFFKWKNNREAGVPGYVTVSPTTMEAKYVKLEKGMKYVPSAYFSENIYRKIHKDFPTTIFGYTHFEVDESGNPYYVSAVYKTTVGLIGGTVVDGAIITDPVTGKSKKYSIADIPEWVDIVWDGDMICSLYNLSYKNINGYWNGTGFGANTGCKQTTSDFGYIAKNNDIYIYTGVTSLASDNSNLGFIVVNSRTGEYKFFASSGANEESAMNSAAGEVQNYNYTASFPSLVNINGQLSYIGVMKDKNDLVKMYYLVNADDYDKVVVKETREECLTAYLAKIDSTKAPSVSDQNVNEDTASISITISVIQYVTEGGNTYVYFGAEDGTVYKSLFSDNENLIFVKAGDTISGKVQDGLFYLN